MRRLKRYKIDADRHEQRWLDTFCHYTDIYPHLVCGEITESTIDLVDLATRFNYYIAGGPAIKITEVAE